MVGVTEAQFVFPVFGFEPEQILGWQCDGPEGPAVIRENTFRVEKLRNLELVDASGRRWSLKSLRRLGRAGRLISWLLLTPLGSSRCRIEWDLEPMPPLSLTDVQDLACETTARFGEDDDWNDELKAETADLIARIRKARSIAELAPILNWPSFASY